MKTSPLLCLALAAALTLAGCTAPTSHVKLGVVTLNLQKPTRSVVADWSAVVQSYDITLTNTDGSGFTPVTATNVAQSTVTISGVGAGVWTIAVQGYNAARTAVVASTTLTNQTLPPAGPITVVLDPSRTGTGGFSYTVSVPDSVAVTALTGVLKYASVSSFSAGGIASDSVSGSLSVSGPAGSGGISTYTISQANLPSGTYRLVLSFVRSDNTVARTASEAINVWDNVVSDKWLDGLGGLQSQDVFGPNDFNSTNAQLQNLDVFIDSKPLSLGFGSTTFTYSNTAASSALTQQLDITPTESQPGQKIELSSDGGLNYTALASGSTATITVAKGLNALRVRVTATNGVSNAVYSVDVTKLVPVASVSIDQASPQTLLTGATLALTTTVLPSFATNTAVTWSSSNDAVATVDANGLVSALTPGPAVITVTTVDGGKWAMVNLTVAPSFFRLFTTPGGFWNEMNAAPSGTSTITGNATALWALSGDQVSRFQGGVWQSGGPAVPGDVQWLAADPWGGLFAASGTQVYQLNGVWQALGAGPTPGLSGLAFAFNTLWGFGNDGQLWQWDAGVWRAQFALPTGTLALAGTPNQLIALTSAQVFRSDATLWIADSLAPPAQSVSVAVAFDSLTSLVQQ